MHILPKGRIQHNNDVTMLACSDERVGDKSCYDGLSRCETLARGSVLLKKLGRVLSCLSRSAGGFNLHDASRRKHSSAASFNDVNQAFVIRGQPISGR